jgi:hypothetical protein
MRGILSDESSQMHKFMMASAISPIKAKQDDLAIEPFVLPQSLCSPLKKGFAGFCLLRGATDQRIQEATGGLHVFGVSPFFGTFRLHSMLPTWSDELDYEFSPDEPISSH